MEEVLIIALQALGELIFQVLIYLPFDVPWTRRNTESETGGGAAAGRSATCSSESALAG